MFKRIGPFWVGINDNCWFTIGRKTWTITLYRGYFKIHTYHREFIFAWNMPRDSMKGFQVRNRAAGSYRKAYIAGRFMLFWSLHTEEAKKRIRQCYGLQEVRN